MFVTKSYTGETLVRAKSQCSVAKESISRGVLQEVGGGV